MGQSFDLTSAEAVQVLLLRHELGGRIKQAVGDTGGQTFQTPWGGVSVPDLSGVAQNVITPPAGHEGYQAAQRGLLGAGAGALLGVGSSLFGKRRKNMLRRAMTGAMIGGGLGAAPSLLRMGLRTATDTPPSTQPVVDRSALVEKAEEQKRQTGGMTTEMQKALSLRQPDPETTDPATGGAATGGAATGGTATGGTATGGSGTADPKPKSNTYFPTVAEGGSATAALLEDQFKQSLEPGSNATLLRENLNQMDVPGILEFGTPPAARSAGQGAIGYGLGRGINRLYDQATLHKKIPDLVQKNVIGQKIEPSVNSAIQQGAQPGKPKLVRGKPGPTGTPVTFEAPTSKTWKSLRNNAWAERTPKGATPRGKMLPRVLAAAGALEPAVEAVTGTGPGKWLHNLLYGTPESQLAQQGDE